MSDSTEIEILKPLWTRLPDGRWAIHDLRGLTLKPKSGFESDFFPFDSELELLTASPPKNISDFFASFGSTDYLMQQSILPVVAWVPGDSTIKCIGTAFVVSCTGYVVTASHVILDPKESGYARTAEKTNNFESFEGVNIGVLKAINPASGISGWQFIPFQQSWYWGKWHPSPLLHEEEKLESLTDIAVCKLPELGGGAAYQPFSLSLNPFKPGERAYAIGYALMKDIPLEYVDGHARMPKFNCELYISVGEVVNVFPGNHLEREVPTPGPCFDFQAKIPGKMSGSPIFGAQGSVVRGVVSRSFSGERHAYGCMMGPAMTLPFTDGRSLKKLMDAGLDGIAVVRGAGL